MSSAATFRWRWKSYLQGGGQMRVWLMLVLGLGISASSTTAEPGLVMQLREKDGPVLAEALRFREVVPPESAAANLRHFLSDPNAVVTLRQFAFRSLGSGEQAYFYQFHAGTGPQEGRYQMRAADGTVAGFDAEPLSPEPETETDHEVISLAAAHEIADTFLRRHYPAWTRCRWWYYPDDVAKDYSLGLEWYQVRGPASALANSPLEVTVDAKSRAVVSFWFPQIRATSVLSPRIGPEQARRLAAQFAPFDPLRYPLSQPLLRIAEGNGVDLGLSYRIGQKPSAAEPDFSGNSVAMIHVSALTGEVDVLLPIGFSPERPRTRKPSPVRSTSEITLSSRNGKHPLYLRSSVAALQGEMLWIRANLLGRVAASVRIHEDGQTVQIRHGERLVAGAEVGARRDAQGWWVPLRATAAQLGWQVHWDSEPRSVTITHPGPAWGDYSAE